MKGFVQKFQDEVAKIFDDKTFTPLDSGNYMKFRYEIEYKGCSCRTTPSGSVRI